MASFPRFDHVGITVLDLDLVAGFFVGLGFEVEGRAHLEGEFLDVVVGIPGSRTEIVMLRPPDGGTGLELSRFIRPGRGAAPQHAPHDEPGLRNVTVEVDDLQSALDRVATAGFGLVGGVGRFEDLWSMASVRGPEGIVVNLAQRLD